MFVRYQFNFLLLNCTVDQSGNFLTISKVIAFILSNNIRSYSLCKVELVNGKEKFIPIIIEPMMSKIYRLLHSESDITVD